METILSEEIIQQRIIKGVAYLGVRRVLLQIILTLSSIVLARILEPSIFGTFAVISFIVGVFSYVTTFGLDKALVWSKSPIKTGQLRVIFTILSVSSFLFALLIFFLAPLSKLIYNGQLSTSDIFWLKLYGFNVFFTNLRCVSASILEKKLDFKKITIGELTILFITGILSIILALKGFGVGSFILGNLVGSILGACLYFYLSPWPFGLDFSFRKIKNLLPFGFNFQAKSLIETLNGAVIPGFVGVVSGTQAVGLINWAGGIRQVGLAPADTVVRLVFPTCSQAQDKPEFLKKIITKVVRISSVLSFPIMALVFSLARPITYIVYTDKWLPGLPSLYLFSIQGIFIMLGGILMDVLLALGESRKVRNITLLWAIMQWFLTVPLVLLWNYNGVALAGILVSATFFIPLAEVKKKIKINIFNEVVPYFLFSVISGAAVFFISQKYIVNSIFDLLVQVILGLLIYFGLVFVFKWREVIADFNVIKNCRFS